MIGSKVIVSGSREFDDYELLSTTLKNYNIIEIVSGMAQGADSLGNRFANENNIVLKEFPANWDLGPQAGILRNIDMANYADMLITFWDGSSKGTEHMISYMKKINKPIKCIIYKNKLEDWF